MLHNIITQGVIEADLIEPVGTCSGCGDDCFFSNESFDCHINGKPAVHNVQGADSHCHRAAIILDKKGV